MKRFANQVIDGRNSWSGTWRRAIAASMTGGLMAVLGAGTAESQEATLFKGGRYQSQNTRVCGSADRCILQMPSVPKFVITERIICRFARSSVDMNIYSKGRKKFLYSFVVGTTTNEMALVLDPDWEIEFEVGAFVGSELSCLIVGAEFK